MVSGQWSGLGLARVRPSALPARTTRPITVVGRGSSDGRARREQQGGRGRFAGAGSRKARALTAAVRAGAGAVRAGAAAVRTGAARCRCGCGCARGAARRGGSAASAAVACAAILAACRAVRVAAAKSSTTAWPSLKPICLGTPLCALCLKVGEPEQPLRQTAPGRKASWRMIPAAALAGRRESACAAWSDSLRCGGERRFAGFWAGWATKKVTAYKKRGNGFQT